MSVFMTLTVHGNAQGMQKFAQEHPEKMKQVLDAAKRHGLIAHRFYGSDDGANMMVLDEWPDRQSFESFYQEQMAEIQPMFESVHTTDQPAPMYWQELSTGDAYGWGA